MQTVREAGQLASALIALRAGGRSLALVPTMGALHAGHLALVDRARRIADHVAVSIFVNPLQFGPSEDLARYPRREAADAAMLRGGGCDLLWLPDPEDMYPPGFATTVSVRGLSERWEGEARPGHFDGVATVVAKLLCAVRPDSAVFGEKDFQQLAVIRRMVLDLHLDIEIVGVPTVREPDGLALSSRNAYLSADERSRAVALPRSLDEARRRILAGEPVEAVLEGAKRALREAEFAGIDYLALVDAQTLEPVERPTGGMRLLAAATIGKTRLIDNLPVELEGSPSR